MEGCRLREGGEADVALVLGLIRELADYEGLLSEVTATADRLRAALSGERPYAEVAIAEDPGGEPLGFALFFHSFSTFLGRPGIYLEDLFVRPEHRGAGIGRALLRHLARLAEERGCGRLEWAVLDWNEPALAFYRPPGAPPATGWGRYPLDRRAP